MTSRIYKDPAMILEMNQDYARGCRGCLNNTKKWRSWKCKFNVEGYPYLGKGTCNLYVHRSKAKKSERRDDKI